MAKKELTAFPTDDQIEKWGMTNTPDAMPKDVFYERVQQNLKDTQDEFTRRTEEILDSIPEWNRSDPAIES